MKIMSATTASSATTVKPDYVVVLHGIFHASTFMDDISRHLSAQGYHVLNLDYPSTKYPMEELVDLIARDIAERLDLAHHTVHFVGHSMGCLLIRGIIHKHRPPNLGRVVMLAPPNQGSEVADFFKDFWIYRAMYGPAGQQLTTDQSAIHELFGQVDYELGIIAGNRSIDPLCSWILPGEDDGKVSVERTKLEGMKAHIVVKANHFFFPNYRVVQHQTSYFLEHGVFEP